MSGNQTQELHFRSARGQWNRGVPIATIVADLGITERAFHTRKRKWRHNPDKWWWFFHREPGTQRISKELVLAHAEQHDFLLTPQIVRLLDEAVEATKNL